MFIVCDGLNNYSYTWEIGSWLQCKHHHLGVFSTTARHDNGGGGHHSATLWAGISTKLVVTITTIQYQFSPLFMHGIFVCFLTITTIQCSALSHLPNPYSVPFLIFANSASLPVRNVWYRNIWRPSPCRIGFTHFTATKSRRVEVIMYRVFTSSSILVLASF